MGKDSFSPRFYSSVLQKLCQTSFSSCVHLRASVCCSWQKTKPSSPCRSVFVSPSHILPHPSVRWPLRGGWVTDLQGQLLLTETSCRTAQGRGAGWCFKTISGLSMTATLKDSQEGPDGSLNIVMKRTVWMFGRIRFPPIQTLETLPPSQNRSWPLLWATLQTAWWFVVF